MNSFNIFFTINYITFLKTFIYENNEKNYLHIKSLKK